MASISPRVLNLLSVRANPAFLYVFLPANRAAIFFREKIMNEYDQFLATKIASRADAGFTIDKDSLNPILYDFQKAITAWAIRKGRAAVFADCGLGKTFIQLEWIQAVVKEKGGQGLIIVPLSVASQTVKEAEKIGMSISYVKTQAEIADRISITNYERLKEFDGSKFQAVVLDESSILKSVGGKTKSRIIEMFAQVPYRLSCTATPSPNDIAEIANQVAYLGLMTRQEMLSKFFVHDDTGWRLKGHARIAFYKWMATWAVFARTPGDIGFSDDRFILPKLTIEPCFVNQEHVLPGELFAKRDLKGIMDRLRERAATIDCKIEALAGMVNGDDAQWLVWCGLNEEANRAVKAIPGSKQVKGGDRIEHKIECMDDFKSGKLRVLVTKPKIAGFGMNFQNAHRMAFVGISDSYETYYQCIRRCWRFGQGERVDVKIMLSNAEQAILGNVKRKEAENAGLIDGVIREVSDFTKQNMQRGEIKQMDEYVTNRSNGESWELDLGDSVETIKGVGDNGVDFTIFSPPFSQLYTYSPSSRDLGNAKNDTEFWHHFDYLIPELLRVIKPGRITAVHCAQIPAMLVRDGYIGLKDFRGDVIRHFQKAGFIYHGEVCIDKNPQAQSIRTHAKGLTFSQLEKDSSWMRPALADYLVLFRKAGDNAVRVDNGGGGEVSRAEWIRLAHPIWYNVRETRTLNARPARSEDDEKHICPLQLDTIHNGIMLWTNRGETVYSPFAGIGSEGYQAIVDGRKFIGCELKKEYYEVAVRNLDEAEEIKAQQGMVLFG